MKKALIVFFVGLAVAGAVTLVFARSPSRNPATDPDPLSARAQVIDGSSAKPTQVAIVVFGPRYGSSPRIIHVPQGPEQDSRAGADERDEAVAPIEDDNADAAPPPSRYRVIPLPRRSDAVAPQRRSDMAAVPHHGDAPILQKLKIAPAARHQSAVAAQPQQQSKIEPLSQRQDDAEPAEADARQSEEVAAPQVRSQMQPQAAPAATEDAANSDDKLTPVYPTPRYDNKIEANDSGPSNRASVTADIPPPPVGYSPPSGLRDHPESKFGPSKK